MAVSFDRDERQCLFDVPDTWDEGDTSDWRGINLFETSEVTLAAS